MRGTRIPVHIVLSHLAAGEDYDTVTEVFKLVVADRAVLITRDVHFINAVRFPSEKTGGIIYIRRGNLTAPEEIDLVEKFLSRHTIEEYNGKLVTLYKGSVKIR